MKQAENITYRQFNAAWNIPHLKISEEDELCCHDFVIWNFLEAILLCLLLNTPSVFILTQRKFI